MLITLLILVGLGLVIAAMYNGLVTTRERVKNAWAQVDVQLKRRYDLIPNLVNTVKGYAKHERDTFTKITEARSQALTAKTTDAHSQAENQLTGALRTLFAVAENYPELKADSNFRALQQELSETESKIAFSRQFYNDTVQKYNIKVQMFPTNLLAGAFGFTQESFFNLDVNAQERDAIVVDFDTEEKK